MVAHDEAPQFLRGFFASVASLAATITDMTSVALTPMLPRYCPWHPLTPRSWLPPSRISSRMRAERRTFDAAAATSAIIRLRIDMKIARFAWGMSVAGK